MGQGSRGNISRSSTYAATTLVLESRVVAFICWQQSMASGHSRSSSGCDSSASSSAAGFIEHTVTRFDTLAGVAIKYGVEVADIKRMNGLLTDLQMFALKTLKIPLPGRHPPTSSANSSGFSSRQPPPRLGYHSNPGLAHILKDSSSKREPEKRPITSAMGLLRGYYGLSTTGRQKVEGMEMAVYKSDSDYLSEDEPFSPVRPLETPTAGDVNDPSSDLPATSHGRSMDVDDYQSIERRRSTGKAKATAPFEPFTRPVSSSDLRLEAVGDSGGGSEIEKANDRVVYRRRGKSDGFGSASDIPFEMYMATEAEGSGDRVIASLGKSSALRQKLPPTLGDDTDSLSRPHVNSALNGWHTGNSDSPGLLAGSAVRALGTSILGGGKAVEGLMSKIRRSASNPSLQDDRKPYKGDSSGPSLVSQGSASSGVISSMLDGFPKPPAARRNKTALD